MSKPLPEIPQTIELEYPVEKRAAKGGAVLETVSSVTIKRRPRFNDLIAVARAEGPRAGDLVAIGRLTDCPAWAAGELDLAVDYRAVMAVISPFFAEDDATSPAASGAGDASP